MSASNRAGAIAKLHSALKKHYSAEPAQPTRPLLEHILYASLLEDCPAELADEGLAKCEQEFFDWNEVRVTTATELAQVLSRLPDPMKAATRLKSNLQSIFEQFYTFDLDHLKKENLGKAVAKFEAMPGMTPFVLNYTVQHGLGGHAIPIDYAAMVMMLVTGIASQSEAMAGRVPGLERAVPKSKAIEFSSLLHQAAVALHQDPGDKTARSVLDTVEKGASHRLDDWLSNKEVAKKQRAAQRKADRVAAEDALADAANAESLEPAKHKSGKKSAEASAAKPAGAKSPTGKTAKADAGGESAKTESGKGSEKAAAAKSPAAKDVGKAAGKKPAPPSATKAADEKPRTNKPASTSKLSKKSAPAAKKPAVPAKKSTPSGKKPSAKKPAAVKKPVSAKKPSPASPSKKTASQSKAPPAGKSKKASTSANKSSGSKKSSNRKLTKSKPR